MHEATPQGGTPYITRIIHALPINPGCERSVFLSGVHHILDFGTIFSKIVVADTRLSGKCDGESCSL